MLIGDTLSPRRKQQKIRAGLALALVLLCAAAGLAACNPVDAWRDLTGASKNDPDPETTPNTQNLAAGEASAYPNLATVPPPPTRAMTEAERDKLTQSLIADRTNAKYTDEKLRAGFAAISAPVPPPPPPPAPPSNEPADKPAAKNASPASTAAGGEANASAATGPRKAGEPPEPGPKESSLEPPQMRSTPQPESSQPPPPPPRQAAMPAPPAPAPLPSALGAAKYQAPPPPPTLTQPAPAVASAGHAEKRAPATSSVEIGDFKFAGQSTALGDGSQPDIDKVLAAYRRDPGRVRVVGYAGVGNGAAEQLTSYRVALDRAQAVAAALTKAGIPADKILAEVAPAASDSGEGRAEVKLEH
jgi:outer membrane protein OmpA-like peptidoglycan-associated protein